MQKKPLFPSSYLEDYLSTTTSSHRSKQAIAYLSILDLLQENHKEVAQGIIKELRDQRQFLKLIASENYTSLTCQLSMGNLFTDKYSEGFVGHRFYAGCENVDLIEKLAIDELKKLYQADHAYVQPHSGADANLIAFWAILTQKVQNREIEKLGKKTLNHLTNEEFEKIRQTLVNQKLMGMGLHSGGHLTHGYRHNITGKMVQAIPYEVDPKTGLLNYHDLKEQVKIHKPTILVAGYSSYPRLINCAKMREIADSVGATLVVDMAHFAGLVAGKVITGEYDPIPFAHVVTSTTHKTLRGPRGGMILCQKEFQEMIDKGCPLVIGGPLPHVMAAKAVAFREANTPSFRKDAHQTVKNARALAETLLRKGVQLFTGGTDNHLLVADVFSTFGLTGRQAERALRRAMMTVNRNTIPQDPNGPWHTSGLRIGTPALTSLGMQEGEMEQIGEMIYSLLQNTQAEDKKGEEIIDPATLEKIQERVKELLSSFPLYPELGPL